MWMNSWPKTTERTCPQTTFGAQIQIIFRHRLRRWSEFLPFSNKEPHERRKERIHTWEWECWHEKAARTFEVKRIFGHQCNDLFGKSWLEIFGERWREFSVDRCANFHPHRHSAKIAPKKCLPPAQPKIFPNGGVTTRLFQIRSQKIYPCSQKWG